MKLGASAQNIFPQTHTLEGASGPVFYTAGVLVALVLWGFGLVWLFFASATIARCRDFPFNLGWWGFTFPLGVYAMCTCQLGRELPSRFFLVLGTVCVPDLIDEARGLTWFLFKDIFPLRRYPMDHRRFRDSKGFRFRTAFCRPVSCQPEGEGEACCKWETRRGEQCIKLAPMKRVHLSDFFPRIVDRK